MNGFLNFIDENRTFYIRDGLIYRIGDIIDGEELDELSGHNVGDKKDSRFILVQEPLKHYNDKTYCRDYLYNIETGSKEEEDAKIDDMKEDFIDLPPIPEKGDGLHRIIAAKELGYETILMWKEI